MLWQVKGNESLPKGRNKNSRDKRCAATTTFLVIQTKSDICKVNPDAVAIPSYRAQRLVVSYLRFVGLAVVHTGTFCLPHRSYAAHSCASSGDRDFKALVCPLCKKTVRFAGSQDPNEQ